MALLECTDLCIGYGSQVIQKSLSFSIEKGDYFFITGENGSGKSTLMKTILGFIKPVSGSISFSSEWNRKGIGYLPQTSEIQKTFPATVMEIVISGCLSDLGWLPFYRKKDLLRAKDIIDMLGMSGYSNKSFRELSGGQQQRVLFARALCAARDILVMDEPAKGFDAEMIDRMHEILLELNKNGVTIIVISHDLSAAKKYGNKFLTLEGRRN